MTDGLTRAQFHSLRRLATLPPSVQLLPTHGAGSFCTASIGSIGFAAVVLVFITADAIAGRPIFYTPALLGGALCYGVTSPAEVIIAPAPVLAYTAIHLFAFLILGAIAAVFASIASRHRLSVELTP